MAHHNKHHAAREYAHTVPMTVFVARLIYFIFGVIITFILLRMILLMLAANQGSGFVDFVYDVSNAFVAPFHGVFSYTPVYGMSIFELSSLVAIVVYSLIAWGLITLVTIGNRDGREEV